MKTGKKQAIVYLSLLCLTQGSLSYGQQSKPFERSFKVNAKSGGPYKLRATVEPKTPPTVVGLAAKSVNDMSPEERDKRARDAVNRMFGDGSNEAPVFDPTTTALVNDLVDSSTPITSSEPTKPTTTPSRAMDPEAHHHNTGGKGGPEDHHHNLPTDGSPGSEQITGRAIDTFYNSLPPDVVSRLAGLGVDPMATVHAAGDPYAPYAMALNRGDFLRMRQIANSDEVTDLAQRIAMLGMAGAAALRNLNKPNVDNFPAKDTLRKVAEDLHYGAQGLDANKPNEAKLKAIAEDISKVWQNMTKPKQN